MNADVDFITPELVILPVVESTVIVDPTAILPFMVVDGEDTVNPVEVIPVNIAFCPVINGHVKLFEIVAFPNVAVCDATVIDVRSPVSTSAVITFVVVRSATIISNPLPKTFGLLRSMVICTSSLSYPPSFWWTSAGEAQ